MKGNHEVGHEFGNCTAKLLTLSPLDRPSEWNEDRVHEQATNVKPCTVSLEQGEHDVTVCVEDKSEGKVYFKVELNSSDYDIHRATWHSVVLPDCQQYGLALIEDNDLDPFLKALVEALDDDGEDGPDGLAQGFTVRSQALPCSRVKLNLDISRATTQGLKNNGGTVQSPSNTMAYAAGGSAATTSSSGVQRVLGGMGDLVDKLQKAVVAGDAQTAQQVAQQLATLRANLDVGVKTEKPADKEIRVKVHVEDRESSGGSIVLNLRPSMKISQLKKKILVNYGFAPEVQKWIIGKKIAKDEDTLGRYLGNLNDAPIYLYLVSSKTIGLTKEDIQRRYGHLFVKAPNRRMSSESMARTPSLTGSHKATTPHTPLTPAAPAFQRQLADVQPIVPGAIPEDQDRGAQASGASREGWACERCTLLNFWTRPSCSACFADRPANLTLPDDYVIPPEEQKRIQRAQEEEKLTKEMQPESDLLTLRESELDLMLQLLHKQRANEQSDPRSGPERCDPDAAPLAEHDPYSDQLPAGADVPDSFIPDANRGMISADSDLVIDGPDDSPETSYDDLRFAEHCVDNRYLERNT